jgi:hypothetical protein
MEPDPLTFHMATESMRIIDQREADAYVRRFMRAIYDRTTPDAQDASVVMLGLVHAFRVPEARKALGMSVKRRGPAPQYDPLKYNYGSPAADVVSRFAQGKLTRAQARQELAEHTNGGNLKTLDGLLDDLCLHLGWPVPDSD